MEYEPNLRELEEYHSTLKELQDAVELISMDSQLKMPSNQQGIDILRQILKDEIPNHQVRIRLRELGWKIETLSTHMEIIKPLVDLGLISLPLFTIHRFDEIEPHFNLYLYLNYRNIIDYAENLRRTSSHSI